MSTLKVIKDRWCAKTPEFFKKVKKIMMTLGGSASALWVANSSMGLDLHPLILDVSKYIIAISVASGLTAQLTQDTSNNQTV